MGMNLFLSWHFFGISEEWIKSVQRFLVSSKQSQNLFHFSNEFRFPLFFHIPVSVRLLFLKTMEYSNYLLTVSQTKSSALVCDKVSFVGGVFFSKSSISSTAPFYPGSYFQIRSIRLTSFAPKVIFFFAFQVIDCQMQKPTAKNEWWNRFLA